jgi:hypothetical protein
LSQIEERIAGRYLSLVVELSRNSISIAAIALTIRGKTNIYPSSLLGRINDEMGLIDATELP